MTFSAARPAHAAVVGIAGIGNFGLPEMLDEEIGQNADFPRTVFFTSGSLGIVTLACSNEH